MAKKTIQEDPQTDPTDTEEYIVAHGVRVNNLKNVSLSIPRDHYTVFTGLSGSGKSSLAFDTLYAEGQRRYVESLSVYARQFVAKMAKPEVDYILGIPPAIAIEQRIPNRTPRSTVGTSSEIYDYLRMFFARVGHTFSPISGEEVKRETTEDVVDFIQSLGEGTPYMICAPLLIPDDRSPMDHLAILRANGYSRVLVGDEVQRINDLVEGKEELPSARQLGEMLLVIDRLRVESDADAARGRVGDSVETAFFEGHGDCRIVWRGGSRSFSDRFEADGIVFEEPTDKLFSFNSSIGACPTCEGFSMVMGIDEDLVVPDKSLSVREGCVQCWHGPKMSRWQRRFITQAGDSGFPLDTPYHELTREEKNLLWHGGKGVRGIDDFFDFLRENQHKMHFRIMLARYRGRSLCPDCQGRRLRKEAFYVKVGGKDIGDLVEMPVSELADWLDALELPEEDVKVGARLLDELRRRVRLLVDIGLGYLTLDRVSGTLSGGESQRINLATSLGGGLIGALYVLDEPSIGLHARDSHLLIDIVRRLTDAGNTVVVVEHDEEMIRAADHLVDLGPLAGRLGGEIVYEGSPKELPARKSKSLTVEYLTGRMMIPWPEERHPFSHTIDIKGAYRHNLKNIDVSIPLGVITVVTGVSGSGKSTLMKDLLYEGMSKYLLYGLSGVKLEMKGLRGDLNAVDRVEYVDQDALGLSSRSNPATYIGLYEDLRSLMGQQPLARQMGFGPGDFSFNREGGRCENCQGEGYVTVEMQFMADMRLLCEECHGKRFKDDILEVTFHDKNIYDFLEMTVEEAIDFFTPLTEEAKEVSSILQGLQVLSDVGLGYVHLGQSSSTLSGGESQRLKLASYLAGVSERCLFIFDEPTTGLHIHDIRTLMGTFRRLVEAGHTVVIVEHNLEVVKLADHVIDLGPEGGLEGGHLVFAGTPEELMECKESYTGQYLRQLYDRQHPAMKRRRKTKKSTTKKQ